MKPRILWLATPSLLLLLFLFTLADLAQGQGPVLTTLPTPTPMPGAIKPGPAPDASAQALPDLVVTKIETTPSTPLAGRPTVISVTIKNLGPGNVASSNNFFTDLYIDPPYAPQVNYHQIYSATLGLPWGAQGFFVASPGSSYVFTTTWVFTDVKTFDIWALVDSSGEDELDIDGIVTEVNEGNNTKKISVSALTSKKFKHTSHQDFLTNMASTLDNSDPSGALSLGHFTEPPFFGWPFSDASCEITPATATVSDYNMASPDFRINEAAAGRQEQPYLTTNGDGVVIAVWQDGRAGDIANQDIYLRYSADGGQTWAPEIKVNDDSYHVNQLNPVAALSEDGNLLVAWQDHRSAAEGRADDGYDIYAQRYVLSGATLLPQGSNMLIGNSASDTKGDQISPDIAVDESGGFYVTWQDKRNGNYDIFATSYTSTGGTYTWSNVKRVNDDPNLTQQSNPTINVIEWVQVVDINWEIGPGPDYKVTVTDVISEPVTVLAVIWEDYRKGNSDLAIAISTDGGETFGYDSFINDDADPASPPAPSGPDQLNPDVALTKDKTMATISVLLPNGKTVPVEVEVPITSIHTVWQDYRNGPNDPDVYYGVSQFGVKQAGNDFEPELTPRARANEKINTDDVLSWQTGPVEQTSPSIASLLCDASADETGWNLFIAWSDGRNYDSLNYDIYYTVRSTCGGMPKGLAANRMLNDGIRLYNFDDSNPSYSDYSDGSPPPGRQLNPSIAIDIQTEWPLVLSGYVYIAWEDDRAGNPQAHRDIHFARSNLTYFNHSSNGFYYGAGSQVSAISDSGSDDTTWYTIDWSAATADSTYITVQTRMGNTIAEVLTSDWYPQRFPYQPQPWDCTALSTGAPLPGYDAPGQHIEDAAGDFWPKARYIQYRVNFFTRESDKTPVLYDVTLYYDNAAPDGNGGDPKIQKLYLPLILR